MTFLRAFFAMFLIGITVGAVGSCGDGATDGDVDSVGNVEGRSFAATTLARIHGRWLPRRHPAPSDGPVTTPPATGAGGATTGPAGAPQTAADIIAAAQTSDGRAIPQSSGSGGACPDVVAVVGFWSCVTLGDTCRYASDGITHQCSCTPVQGEGSLPTWTCS